MSKLFFENYVVIYILKSDNSKSNFTNFKNKSNPLQHNLMPALAKFFIGGIKLLIESGIFVFKYFIFSPV